jgi:hypothetical protein
MLVDTTGLDGDLSYPSPVVEYGVLQDRPMGSNWGMSGPFTSWYPLQNPGKRGSIKTGGSTHAMCADIAKLIGANANAVAIQLFSSPPVAAEPRAYWVDVT